MRKAPIKAIPFAALIAFVSWQGAMDGLSTELTDALKLPNGVADTVKPEDFERVSSGKLRLVLDLGKRYRYVADGTRKPKAGTAP